MKIKDTYQIVEILDNIVLINISDVNRNLIKLNNTSKDIVELLMKNKSKEEIIDYMLETYKVDFDTVSKDFDNLINTLKEASVIDD